MKSKQEFKGYEGFKRRLVQLTAIIEADLRKLKHDPYELMTRMVQPTIWLLIFGQAMSQMRPQQLSSLSYLDYIAPGVLAQSILFISIFFGISLIWERDMGVLHKIIVSPAPRILLVAARAISAGLRSVPQLLIVYFIAFWLGIHLRLEFFAFIGVLFTVMIGAAIFSTFSSIVAILVKKRERFMGVGQVLAMPLFFASNALYPIELMPKWLQFLSVINPLTYQVDALRSFMITGHASYFNLCIDFGLSLSLLFFFTIIASFLYPKILR